MWLEQQSKWAEIFLELSQYKRGIPLEEASARDRNESKSSTKIPGWLNMQTCFPSYQMEDYNVAMSNMQSRTRMYRCRHDWKGASFSFPGRAVLTPPEYRSAYYRRSQRQLRPAMNDFEALSFFNSSEALSILPSYRAIGVKYKQGSNAKGPLPQGILSSTMYSK